MKSKLFKNKNYVKLMGATIVTRFGDAVDSIALSWMVYVLTGSTVLMGLLFAISFIPNIVGLPFAGVLADIASKKKITVIGDLGRGISVSIMAVMYYFDVLEVWHLFIFIIINSLFEAFATPSRTSMVQEILKEDEYVSGSSYLSSASTFGELVGISLAGVFIAVIGIWGAILIDGITFFVSAIMVKCIHIKEIKALKDGDKVNIRNFLGMIKDGFLYVKSQKTILSIILLGAFLNFSFVPFNVLRPVYVDVVLNSGAEGLSYTGIGLLIGIMIGGIIVGKIGEKLNPIITISIALALMGLNYALLGLPGVVEFEILSPMIYAIVISFFFGFFLPFAQAPIRGLILRNTESDKIGRISSIMGIMTLSAMPIGGAVVGFVGKFLPVYSLFIYMGLAGLIVSLAFGLKNYSKATEVTV